MNGWIYIDSENINLLSMDSFEGFESITYKNKVLLRQVDGRFEKDKVFSQDDRYIIIFEGVLLNLCELKSKYNKSNAFELLTHLYEEKGNSFINELRGPFSCVFIDKLKDISLSFANHTGDTAAYFYENKDLFVSSSDFEYIIRFLKENKITYNLDPLAVRYMLTYGFMADDTTFAKEIKRILPGTVLINRNGIKEFERYFNLNNSDVLDCTMMEAVELIDDGFRKAVKRCFDKDLEYGYRNHLADMSAGLDSRMVSWVAKDMGYNNITNISYSQWSSDENKIASEVSRKLENNYVHLQLDDALFIYDIDEIINLNGGAAYYVGITGGNRLLSYLNFNKFGLEHTGQLGDVIISSFCNTPFHTAPDYNSGRNSTTLNLKFDEKTVKGKYDNNELFLMSTRGFLGANSSHLIRKNYTYAVSPFIDVDFLNLCFSIPLNLRIKHNLYSEWMRIKYPKAYQIPSSTVFGKENTLKKVNIFTKKVIGKVKRETMKIMHKGGLIDSATNPNNMNPFSYWYDTNPKIQNFIKNYFEESYKQLNLDDKTKNYIITMYNSDNALDKLMALTVLGVNNNMFN